jgi:hypothetical protein
MPGKEVSAPHAQAHALSLAPAMLFAFSWYSRGSGMGTVTNLFDAYAVQCECGASCMTLLRSGKVLCQKCNATWSNLTWSCRSCPGDRTCCRHGATVGSPQEA